MRFGSLFSGIGGIDLGLERAGMECAWQVENNPYCVQVLEKHWPKVKRYGDVHECGRHNLEPVDLICGGFPCQPVSLAGKRLAQADLRWLWPEFARIIRELRPRYALVENVPGLLSAGIGDVLGDLASLGYDAEWQSIPAAAVGAPHLRYRVFIVAYARESGRQQVARGAHGDEGTDEGWAEAQTDLLDGHGQGDSSGTMANTERGDGRWRADEQRWQTEGRVVAGGDSSAVADPDGARQQSSEGSRGSGRASASIDDSRRGCSDVADAECKGRRQRAGVFENGWRSGEFVGDDWWAIEPDVGRVADGVPHRVDRLRGVGNAVVPQVAEWIGRRIMAAEVLA